MSLLHSKSVRKHQVIITKVNKKYDGLY